MPPRAAAGRRAARGTAAEGGLPLQLPEPPPFPGRLRPEEAVPCSEAFDSPDWRFSVDWEGARCLLFVAADGSVQVQGHNLADLTPRLPELAAAGSMVMRRPAVLDGVVAVLEPSGRPDLLGLSLRLLQLPSGSTVPPPVFLAGDVLQLPEGSTLQWPLDRRLEALEQLVDSSTTIQVPEHISGRGRALAEAAAARRLPALLARRGAAPYRPRVASPDRLRVELAPRATCIVAGVEPSRTSAVGRLLLAEHVEGRLAFAGLCDGPRDRRIEAWLRRQVDLLHAAHAPVHVIDAHRRTAWLRPVLTATVTYGARSQGGLLMRPQLIALRDDVDPDWCVRRTPLPPPEDSRGSAFVPTVLMPLPLDDSVLLPGQPH